MAVQKTIVLAAATTTYDLTNGSEVSASQGCLQIVGTISAGTAAVYGSMDGGTTKVALLLVPWDSTTTATSFSAAGAWRVDLSGVPRVYLVTDGDFATTGAVTAYFHAVIG